MFHHFKRAPGCRFRTCLIHFSIDLFIKPFSLGRSISLYGKPLSERVFFKNDKKGSAFHRFVHIIITANHKCLLPIVRSLARLLAAVMLACMSSHTAVSSVFLVSHHVNALVTDELEHMSIKTLWDYPQILQAVSIRRGRIAKPFCFINHHTHDRKPFSCTLASPKAHVI